MSTRRVALLLATIAALAALWVSLREHPVEPAAEARPGPSEGKGPASNRGPRDMASDWRAMLDACGAKTPAPEIRRQLEDLRDRWLGGPDPSASAASITMFLRSGEDARTGLPFRPGAGASLQGWPSLRVFLLDLLQVLDPDRAVEIGRELLATTRSAEEFATALRPLARRGPWRASDAELASHLATLLAHRDWQSARQPGFAEALDLVRATATPESARLLAKWVEQGPPLAEAGEMALHETAAESPAAVVSALASDPPVFADRPTLRASLMARASASDLSQAATVEAYVTNPHVTDEEKRAFLAVYPLRSATTGYRLYGSPPAPYTRSAVVADDQAALAIVNRWLSNPSLASLQPDLSALQDRLLKWTAQSGN